MAVWDTGIGTVPEDQQRIFEKFQQAGNELTRTKKGLVWAWC
jgi:signal transduction histidine kinase